MSLLEVAPGRLRHSTSSERAALALVALAAVGLALPTLGCSGAASTTPVAKVDPVSRGADASRPSPRPPLSADEAAMIPLLEAHVEHLVGIGERTPERPWELASAADYIVERFEAVGYPVERVGFEVSGIAAQNLAVTIVGNEKPNDVWVVGAHYDTARGDRGEEHDATGVAALLEIARMMRGARCSSTLRLVAFTLSAPPYAGTENMGSVRYLKHLADKPVAADEEREKLVGMFDLDGVGALGDAAEPVGRVRVRLGASTGADDLARRLAKELAEDPFEVQTEGLAGTPSSDQWAFARQGIPAVWVSAAGASHRLDYDGMTRLVMKMRFFLAELVGEQPTNDGMLTPVMEPVR